MNRLTDSDKNWGPFTLARWSNRISCSIRSGDDEDPECTVLLVAFGWALRIRVWNWLCQPWRARWIECNWDAETVKRLGRNGYWEIHEREFGFSLSDMGAGYDFLQLFFGPQTNDSSTTKSWSKHLPWKMWNHVRHSLYCPDGSHFATMKPRGWEEFYQKKQECPASYFSFQDYDGEMIEATCVVEEREWRKGEGWFKWLKWFYPKKVIRSLDLKFSSEVGKEKGSWKGGTIGHGIDMLKDETPQQAFERYCSMEHRSKSGKYTIRFVGRSTKPLERNKTPVADDCGDIVKATLP